MLYRAVRQKRADDSVQARAASFLSPPLFPAVFHRPTLSPSSGSPPPAQDDGVGSLLPAAPPGAGPALSWPHPSSLLHRSSFLLAPPLLSCAGHSSPAPSLSWRRSAPAPYQAVLIHEIRGRVMNRTWC
ncbi:hypothetical protein ABZP36_028988 [Zizania latifolia]